MTPGVYLSRATRRGWMHTCKMQVTRYRTLPDGASDPLSVTYHGWVPAPRSPTRSSTRSPLATALDRIGDRWTPLIVEALLAGPRRYGELEAAIPGIAPNILADRLRRLEADGLLTLTAYEERPPRFEYRLTAEGRALASALRLLADWGARHGVADLGAHESIRHDACGTALQARWYCPTCDSTLEDGVSAPPETRRL